MGGIIPAAFPLNATGISLILEPVYLLKGNRRVAGRLVFGVESEGIQAAAARTPLPKGSKPGDVGWRVFLMEICLIR